MGRGAINLTAAAEAPRRSRASDASLAPEARWKALEATDPLLGRKAAAELGQRIRAFAARPGGEPDQPSPIQGTDFERIWAEAVTPLNGEVIHDARGELDVIVGGHLPGSSARVGWECKVENNLNRIDVPVLCRLHPEDLQLTSNANILGRRLIEALGRAHNDYCRLHSVVDSRLVFLWGRPAQGRMLLWEEPYYPGEIDPHELDWQRRENSLVAAGADGRPVFSWYPRGHQFKYHARPPTKPAAVIELPESSLDDRAYARAVTAALVAG